MTARVIYVSSGKTGPTGPPTSFDFKGSVRVATTANITLSGAQTIDNVAVIAGNRVLVKDQSTASQNGIYVAAAGAWARAADADATGEVSAGLTVSVEEGTVSAGRAYILSTPNPIVIGTTALTFATVNAGDLKAANNLSELTATAATARTNLGVAIGTDVQAYDADLAAIAAVAAQTAYGRSMLTLTDAADLGAELSSQFAPLRAFDPRITDGAVGDGITDDTAAIQACVNRMIVSVGLGGGILDLSNGEFLISDTILFLKFAGEIVGSGWTNAKTYIPSGGVSGTDDSFGTTIRWAVGAGNTKPMFQVRDSQGVTFRGIKFQGASQSVNPLDTPTAAINFHWLTGDNKGSNAKLFVDQCYIGRFPWTDGADDHAVAVGILFDGDNGNNDEWLVSRCKIKQCTTHGIKLTGTQSTWNRVTDTLIDLCPIGFETNSDIGTDNLHFNNCDLDWKFGLSVTANLTRYMSENAKKFAELGTGARLVVNGGDLNVEELTATNMIEALAVSENRIVLRNVEFDLGPTTSKIHMGSIVGGTTRHGYFEMNDCVGLDPATNLDIVPSSANNFRSVLINAPGNNVYERRRLANGDTLTLAGYSTIAAASAVTFTPVGTIAATDVQTAIAEVATDAAAALALINSPLFVRKTADTARNTTATVADDPHLVIAVAANSTYTLRGILVYDGATTGDLKVAITVPSGATILYSTLGPGSAVTSYTAATMRATIGDGGTFGGVAAGTKGHVRLDGVVIVAATPGNVVVQWAQGASDAADTTVFTSSFLTLQKVA